MKSIDEREVNLFNATETLGRFYEEIEAFLDIAYSNMKRLGFTDKGERLLAGTFAVKNLARRLLASVTVMYIRGTEELEDGADDGIEEDMEEGDESEKPGKQEVPIVDGLRIPFLHISLFEPNTIPTRKTMSSPSLCLGAIGDLGFEDKKDGQSARPVSPVVALTNLAHLRIRDDYAIGRALRQNIWKPSKMKKYRLVGKLVHFEKSQLLEFDSQEKIKAIAEQLDGFTRAAKNS